MKLPVTLVATATLLFVCAPLFAQAPSTEPFVEVARFFNMSGSALHYAQQSAQAVRKQNPAAADAFEKALSYWDANVADRRMAVLLQREMSTADAATIAKFWATPLGARLSQIFKQPPDEWIVAVKSMPSTDRQQAENFLRSGPANKALRAFDSKEAQSLWKAYGEDLMCQHFATSDLSALAKLQGLGKCLAVR